MAAIDSLNGNVPAMLKRRSLLSTPECAQIVQTILGLSAHWLQRGQIDFYTLGAASYLAGAWDAESYRSRSQHANPILKQAFQPLYTRLQNCLEQLLGPVRFHPGLALPGFHIFASRPRQAMLQGTAAWARSGGSIHLDLQYRMHDSFWQQFASVDWHQPLSFTLALELPAEGSGLRIWPDCRIPGEAAADAAVFVPYRVGEMVLFVQPLVHQIAPVQTLATQDRRITLQGHGLRCDGSWILYF